MGPFQELYRWLKRNDERDSIANRVLFVGNNIPEGAIQDEDKVRVFPDNEIKSSKYTVWNFVPKNLFEQFRRVANFYFLCIGIITLLIDSPVSPITDWLPLIFVIIVTAVKQGYEDLQRHRNDRKVNLKLIDVVKNGHISQVKSKYINVGDVVKIYEDQSLPCDVVLLASSNEQGKCYLTTANLDGETNLKLKTRPKLVQDLSTPEQLDKLRAHIECQQPKVDLYQFIGTLTVYGGENGTMTTHLGLENLLPRGCRLKDTSFIYGCAVYTGKDTKLALNSKLTNNKFSTAEKSLNKFLLFILGILLLEVFIFTLQKHLMPHVDDVLPFIEPDHPVSARVIFNDAASFIILFNYIIPISLYVTIEVQKFFGSWFFGWDEELRCPVTGQNAVCNTSDLNEELGQVQYLLSDKTGTLTQNQMEFRQCSINGSKYVEKDGRLWMATDNSARFLHNCENLPEVEQFLVALALCHTVRITDNSSMANGSEESLEITIDNLNYQASSPDEKALVEACSRFDVVYCEEKNETYTLNVMGNKRYYEVLQVLEFDSSRKRMSIIARFPDGSIWLICKGAESHMIPQCTEGPIENTLMHINDYALLGLRTLAIAVRPLSQSEYESIEQQLEAAQQNLDNREEALRQAFDAIESQMCLLGATGVEDQLQDYVQETLESLKAAGMKIWILTGDKLETAVNIAYSCGHFKRTIDLLELKSQSEAEFLEKESLLQFRKRIWDNPDHEFGLVIDGQSLALAMKHSEKILAEVSSLCRAVVCCRMSPIQKAEVVKLVKSFPGKPVTAAVGDGANDVSMIQEAHVGLGIFGKEGQQAARCSDFAFGQFSFLRRIFLVHGHWYYWRLSTLVQYFFYKNIVFNTPAVFYTIYCAFSAQSVYEGILLSLFNTTFTALPIVFYGLFEKNFSEEQLLQNVHLYENISKNARMTWKQFFKWNLLGLWHSVVIYFGTHLMFYYKSDTFNGYLYMDLYSFGCYLCNAVVVVVTIKLLLETHYWTLIYVAATAFSISVVYVSFMAFYSGFYSDLLMNDVMVWIYMVQASSGPGWLLLLLMTIICLLPDMLIGMWECYSLGHGVVVKLKRSPGEYLDHRFQRVFSVMKQRSQGSFNIT